MGLNTRPSYPLVSRSFSLLHQFTPSDFRGLLNRPSVSLFGHKMAASKGTFKNFLQILSHCQWKFYNSPSQLFLYREFASTLFVKGMYFSSTEESLANAFSNFGEIIEAKLIRDKASNRSKGYGYVIYGTEDEAQKALMEMIRKEVDGRNVKVDTDANRR